MSQVPSGESQERYKKSYVVMEWGGAPFSWVDAMDFPGREKDVIAIDVNKDRPRLQGRRPSDERVSVESLRVDVTSERFLNDAVFNGSVDLLIANNMVGELIPAVEGALWQRIKQNLKPGYESALPRVLSKIAAMLKPSGEAVIGQWNTPDFGDELYTLKDDTTTLEKYGLRAEFIEKASEVERLLDRLNIASTEKERVRHYFLEKPEKQRTHIPPFILVLEKIA